MSKPKKKTKRKPAEQAETSAEKSLPPQRRRGPSPEFVVVARKAAVMELVRAAPLVTNDEIDRVFQERALGLRLIDPRDPSRGRVPPDKTFEIGRDQLDRYIADVRKSLRDPMLLSPEKRAEALADARLELRADRARARRLNQMGPVMTSHKIEGGWLGFDSDGTTVNVNIGTEGIRSSDRNKKLDDLIAERERLRAGAAAKANGANGSNGHANGNGHADH